jgi:hypothetical protein
MIGGLFGGAMTPDEEKQILGLLGVRVRGASQAANQSRVSTGPALGTGLRAAAQGIGDLRRSALKRTQLEEQARLNALRKQWFIRQLAARKQGGPGSGLTTVERPAEPGDWEDDFINGDPPADRPASAGLTPTGAAPAAPPDPTAQRTTPTTPPLLSARQAEDQSLAAMQTGAAAPARPQAPLAGRRPLPRVPSALGRMVRETPARLRRDQERAQAPDPRIPQPPGPPQGFARPPVQRPPTRKDLPFNTRVYNWYAPTVKAINDGIRYYAGPHLSQSLANLTEMLRFTDLGDAEAYNNETQNLQDTLARWKPGKSGGAAVANQLPITAAAMVGMVAPGVPAKGAVQLAKLGKAGKTAAKRPPKARGAAAGRGPKTALVYQHAEGVAGAGTNHLPGLLNAPDKRRAAFTSRISKAFQDPQGMDIINKNIGLRPIPTRRAQGAFRASPRHQVEYNQIYVPGSEVPLVGGNRLRKADEQRFRSAATLRAGMTGQFAEEAEPERDQGICR